MPLMKLQTTNRLHALDKRVEEHAIMRGCLDATLDTLEQQIAILQKASQQLAQSLFPDTFNLLNGIPGVGQVMTTVIIGYYGNFESFENANQVVAFSGLNPNPRESGTSMKFRGKISKKGHASLRKVVYMCAFIGTRKNV